MSAIFERVTTRQCELVRELGISLSVVPKDGGVTEDGVIVIVSPLHPPTPGAIDLPMSRGEFHKQLVPWPDNSWRERAKTAIDIDWADTLAQR